ncbi:hypothetical protein HYS92_00250 [Candidatus Daviesbacteria bacterium]|nr:hypothetical protein [Candidatus Daviesbacteria bacterium]
MNKNIAIIYWILIIGLIIRLLLSFLPAFEADQSAFRFWTARLASGGPANFYSPDIFTNNPLGILYFFWFIGLIKNSILSSLPFTINLDLLLKLAANLADISTGFIIYKIVRKELNERLAYIATALYIFNPGLSFNSAIWGQYDGVAIFFLLLSIYSIFIKKSPIVGSILFSVAWIVKPQSLELAPFLIFYFIKYFKPIQWGYSLLAFILITLIVYLPFFPSNPLYGIYYVNYGSTKLFNCTSCNALNFWGIIGNWQNDANLFLGIPMLTWGFLLTSIFLIIIFSLNKIKGNILYLTISISMLAFFMFLTRMHERYFSYFFPFLLLSAMTLKSKVLIGFYIFFSLVFLLNLYLPYSYYNNSVGITNLPFNNLLSSNLFSYMSLIVFLGFMFFYIYYLKYAKDN